jgi:RimJ/RimL family protein N-acetyltransferase
MRQDAALPVQWPRGPGQQVVVETPRLVLRRMRVQDDTGAVLELLNDPAFIEFIGDKRVRTADAARLYIEAGPLTSYERFGFGLYMMVSKVSGQSIGICGLLKREALEDVDVGYALLPAFRGMGYAFEAASAVVRYGYDTLGLRRIVAVTNADNERSIRVLERLGLRFERTVVIAESSHELHLYAPPT